MKTKELSQDSPLGLGWLTGHFTLDEAIVALVKESGKSREQILDEYEIPALTKEEPRKP